VFEKNRDLLLTGIMISPACVKGQPFPPLLHIGYSRMTGSGN
jgi:hypothetical protein